MGLQEKLEKHWMGSLLLVAVVVAGGTWTVLNEVLVRPRDEELSRLQRRLEEVESNEHARSNAPGLKAADAKEVPKPQAALLERGSLKDVILPGKEGAPDAASSNSRENQGPLVFSDGEYLRASVVSVQRTGGRVVLTLSYENLSNTEYRVAIYNGGAQGKDTMLIDSNGERWRMVSSSSGGTSGPEGIIFLPHLPSKVVVTFGKAAGDTAVKSFTLINYAHLYPPQASSHVTEVVIRDIPSTFSS